MVCLLRNQGWYFSSSCPEVFNKKGFLKNFSKLKEKHLRLSLFFNKVVVLMPTMLLKNRLLHRCFQVNFVRFLKTDFLWNTSGGCFWYCIWKRKKSILDKYMFCMVLYVFEKKIAKKKLNPIAIFQYCHFY